MRLLEKLRGERGYTLVEMLTVVTIMGVVMSGVTALFVQGSNASVDMNARFISQQNARLALNKIRREAHCASVVTTSGTSAVRNGVTYYPTMTETLPSGCGTQISWCTVSAGTSRYALYRKTGATCNSTGTKYADYLTVGTIFAFTAQSTQSLAKLTVDFFVNQKPAKTQELYELKTDIALRNSTRS